MTLIYCRNMLTFNYRKDVQFSIMQGGTKTHSLDEAKFAAGTVSKHVRKADANWPSDRKEWLRIKYIIAN